MDKHEHQNKRNGNKLAGQLAVMGEIADITGNGERHNGKAGRIGTDELSCSGDKGDWTPACHFEVLVDTAIDGVCRIKFSIKQRSRDLVQATQEEGQSDKQGAAGSIGDFSNGTEDTRTNSRSDADGDCSGKTKLTSQAVRL